MLKTKNNFKLKIILNFLFIFVCSISLITFTYSKEVCGTDSTTGEEICYDDNNPYILPNILSNVKEKITQTPAEPGAKSIFYEMVSFTKGGNSGSAQTPLINLNLINKERFEINYQNIGFGFQFFFNFLIGISIATAVIVFMIGAFEGILAGAGGKVDIPGKFRSKERMQNSIIGLMIILSTWLIVNTINPDLLRLPIFNSVKGDTGANAQTPSLNVSSGENISI